MKKNRQKSSNVRAKVIPNGTKPSEGGKGTKETDLGERKESPAHTPEKPVVAPRAPNPPKFVHKTSEEIIREKKGIAVARSLAISAFIVVVGVGKVIAQQQEADYLGGYRDSTPLRGASTMNEAEAKTCPGGTASSKPHEGEPADHSGNSGDDPSGGLDIICVSGRHAHVFERADSVFVAVYDN